MLRVLCMALLLVSGAAAQEMAISVIGGWTYYGEITEVENGLLSLNCTAFSEEMPRLNPITATGPYFKIPEAMKCSPKDISIGTGTIIQIVPLKDVYLKWWPPLEAS